MSQPAPVVLIPGKVHAVTPRSVDPVPAREASYDDAGNLLRRALPAREGYDVVDLTVLTRDGGFCTIIAMPAALEAIGGELPAAGDEVDLPARPFCKWERVGARSYQVVGYSLAGDVLAASKGRHTPRAVSAAS